jgi:hypothetical protein
MIAKISIVGVDDSVCPQDLVDISQTYPFAEWGVNLCPDSEQKPAYPSAEWLDELLQYSENLRLRGILHGRWESDILEGSSSISIERPDMWNEFRWLQVDIRNDQKKIFESIDKHPRKLILETNIIPMFKSNILLPRSRVFSCYDYCGYSILEDDIDWIGKSKKLFWISVDGFRSDDNITMDLTKVCGFLNKAKEFVKPLRHKSWLV